MCIFHIMKKYNSIISINKIKSKAIWAIYIYTHNYPTYNWARIWSLPTYYLLVI